MLAMDQIVNLGAKLQYMSDGQFLGPVGDPDAERGGTKHGPQHLAEPRDPVCAHSPGLIVALPSDAADAYWMLREAIRCDDPVIFLENKYLYFRSIEEIDENEGAAGYGARVVRPGDDVTVVSAGSMTGRCCEAATRLQRPGSAPAASCEVIDLRYIWRWDTDLIAKSVKKTGRLAVVHEGRRVLRWGRRSPLGPRSTCFLELDAPITPRGIGASAGPVRVRTRGSDHPDNRARSCHSCRALAEILRR